MGKKEAAPWSYTELFCFRLTALGRKIGRIHSKACAEYKITAGQSFVLFDLQAHEGSSMTEISTRLQLDTPAVTGYIDRLEKEALVVRDSDPNDRRSLRISLTEKGKEIVQLIQPKTQAVHDRIKGVLTEEEYAVFHRCLCAIESELS